MPEPNVDKGKEAFDRNNCLSCHGNGSSSAPFTGPSLWGPDSFNTGAGMSRFSKMYDFIYHNMPFGEEGTLSKQEASDITAYILTQDRPEFVNKSKEKFYPKGGEPDDKISEKEREQILNHDYDWQELEEVSSK
ncbi:c-type cytochrome [Mammaliicoccus lentus]|uniref:c-type cytochrome n=1 Tax=Mammaliicoccus lentus TaxID=42858 RepID=UPI003CF3ABCD